MEEQLSPENIVERLEEHWAEIAVLFPRQDEDIHTGLRDEIIECYQTPGRHYHVLEHLLETLDNVKLFRHHCDNYLDTMLAAWYHDVVYEPGKRHNESASAVLAAQHMHMLGFEEETIGHVMDMINATTDHVDVNDDPDFRVLSDADMAILATPFERYERYMIDTREEYRPVADDDVWRSEYGRPKFIRGILERLKDGHLYYLPEMQQKEPQLEENLNYELLLLTN